MCDVLHIPARVFNIYNFGGVGGGHSCAQTWYDGQWHFFDVTYAVRVHLDWKVLSWGQIQADPESAIQRMVVFERTRDRWGWPDAEADKRTKVDNSKRMRATYTAEAIRQARSHGFYGYQDVKMLYASLDLERVEQPLLLGQRNGDYKDVSEAGVERKVSERLGESLGTWFDTFHITWEFKNCRPGRTYELRYYLYRATRAGLSYWVKSDDADILSGMRFASGPGLVDRRPAIWEIRFRPKADSCSIRIGYDFRVARRGVYVDAIEIMPCGDG